MHKTARYLTALGFGLSASAIVGWLVLRESKRGRALPAITVKSRNRDMEPDNIPPIVLPLDVIKSEDEAPSPDAAGDDLTQINDIGPRFAAALREIGITHFAQLAKQTPEALAEQLAQHVTVRAQRIQDKDWIGQAARLAKR